MIEGKSKKNTKAKTSSDGQSDGTEAPAFRQNDAVNARIDRYIQEHARDAEYYRALPPERLFRSVIRFLAEREDNKLRVDQNLIKRLDRHPEIKEATMKAVESLPEDQQQKIIVNVARALPTNTAQLSTAPSASP